jgi:hypothetical protein
MPYLPASLKQLHSSIVSFTSFVNNTHEKVLHSIP